jgi:MFS family permease
MASLYRHPDFLRLWASQSVSLLGSQFSLLAIPLTAVLVLRATPLQMGLLSAAGFGPGLLFGLPAGVWVDRSRRRWTLLTANAVSCVALATIPVASALHLLRIEQLYVVAFVAGTAGTLFLIAFRAYLPTMVQEKQLMEANSKLETSGAVAQLVGPASAGGVVQLLSAPLAVGVDSISFLVAGIGLATIRGRESGPSRASSLSLVAEARAGMVELLSNRLVRPLALCTATFNFWWSVVFALYVLYVTVRLRVSPTELGAIFTMASVGALVGARLAQPSSRVLGVGKVLTGAPLIAGTGLALVPLAAGPHPLVLVELAAAQVISGLGICAFNIDQVSVRQVVSPSHLQGRVNAGFHALSMSAKLLGSLVGGLLGTAVDLRAGLAIGSMGALGAFLWLLFSPVRRLAGLQFEASL